MTFYTVTFWGLRKNLKEKILPMSDSVPAQMKRPTGALGCSKIHTFLKIFAPTSFSH